MKIYSPLTSACFQATLSNQLIELLPCALELLNSLWKHTKAAVNKPINSIVLREWVYDRNRSAVSLNILVGGGVWCGGWAYMVLAFWWLLPRKLSECLVRDSTYLFQLPNLRWIYKWGSMLLGAEVTVSYYIIPLSAILCFCWIVSVHLYFLS